MNDITSVSKTALPPKGDGIAADPLKKLNRVSWWAGLIAKIMMILVVLAIVFLCYGLIYLYSNPLPWGGSAPWNTASFVYTISYVVRAVLLVMILYFINHMFMNIRRNNTPFMGVVVKDLRIMSILVLVYGLVPLIEACVFMYVIDFYHIQLVTSSLDLYIFFLSFIIYAVSLVFSYGVALQKASDETL